MWVLESFSRVVVAGPFKSQAEMAKKLGVSQQYVNRKIRKRNFVFHLDGQKVLAIRQKEFVGGGKKGSDKEELAMRLRVPRKAVEKSSPQKQFWACSNAAGESENSKTQTRGKTSSPSSPRFVE